MKNFTLLALAVLVLAGCQAPAETNPTPDSDTITITAEPATPAETTPEIKIEITAEPAPVIIKAEPTPEPIKTMPKEITELKIETLSKGTGAIAENGNFLEMHYTGTLTDGTKFDSSVDRGEPFRFTLGTGQVIEGWDKGIVGMVVGEKRKLTIPYKMAYGEAGFPPVIPAKATLVFEIELLNILTPGWQQ